MKNRRIKRSTMGILKKIGELLILSNVLFRF